MPGYRIKCERGMSRPRAGFGFQRSLGRQEVGLRVNGVNVDEVGAQVRDQDVLLGGVEECFVRVWRVLAVWDCARAGEGVGEGLGGRDMAGGGDVVSLEGTACAVVERRWGSVVCRTEVFDVGGLFAFGKL